MSVQCEDFVHIAERLVLSESSEIARRVAAGRAYYGAYHCCRNLVDRQPSIDVNDRLGAHERVYDAIGRLTLTFPGARELKKMAYKAMQIRDIRAVADYELHGEFRFEQAQQAIESAKIVHTLHLAFILKFAAQLT